MTNPCCPYLGELVTLSQLTPPPRPVTTVFIHCSATSNENVNAEDVDVWHLARGWDCIGYHFFIPSRGKIQYGRDLELTPAAQKGHNANSIAICLNGLQNSDFTPAQFDSLRHLCHRLATIIPNPLRFRGHCEVSPKACPVFDYKAVLSLDDHSHLPSTSPLEALENYMAPPAEATTTGSGRRPVMAEWHVMGTYDQRKEVWGQLIGWGFDILEIDSERSHTYSVALIEDNTGKVHCPPAETVRFMDRLDSDKQQWKLKTRADQ